jgi:hypothetical protein
MAMDSSTNAILRTWIGSAGGGSPGSAGRSINSEFSGVCIVYRTVSASDVLCCERIETKRGGATRPSSRSLETFGVTIGGCGSDSLFASRRDIGRARSLEDRFRAVDLLGRIAVSG